MENNKKITKLTELEELKKDMSLQFNEAGEFELNEQECLLKINHQSGDVIFISPQLLGELEYFKNGANYFSSKFIVAKYTFTLSFDHNSASTFMDFLLIWASISSDVLFSGGRWSDINIYIPVHSALDYEHESGLKPHKYDYIGDSIIKRIYTEILQIIKNYEAIGEYTLKHI